MNLRRVRLALLLYVGFDLFFGGICGGFFQLTPLAAAQFTTVSGTVTDPNGLPYANGTIVATLITSASPTLGGFAYTPPSQPVGLSSSGSFVMQLADNTQLSPGGTQWKFQVCSAAGTVQPAIGAGPVCFTAVAITISGVSQNITAQLTAAAIALATSVSVVTGFLLPGLPGSLSFGSGSLVTTQNEMECIRFLSPFSITASHFSYVPTVSAGAASHVGFALYNTTGSTRLMTTGALDGTLVGKQTLTLSSFALNVGTPYLLCWTDDQAAPTTWAAYAYGFTGATLSNVINTSATNNFVKGTNSSVAGAPPTSLGTLNAYSGGSGEPLVFLEP